MIALFSDIETFVISKRWIFSRVSLQVFKFLSSFARVPAGFLSDLGSLAFCRGDKPRRNKNLRWAGQEANLQTICGTCSRSKWSSSLLYGAAARRQGQLPWRLTCIQCVSFSRYLSTSNGDYSHLIVVWYPLIGSVLPDGIPAWVLLNHVVLKDISHWRCRFASNPVF